MTESILMSPPTVKNCIGWTFSPLPQIGSAAETLLTTPTGLDRATKVGCKSQSYTSWNCISRSYVGGVYVLEENNQVARHLQPPVEEVTGDTPTQEEIAAFSPAQKILYHQGVKHFVREKGLLQMLKLQRQMENNSIHTEEASGSRICTRAQQTVNVEADPNLGFYYSDIIPIRAVAVSSKICSRETDPIPYSPEYQILAGRLNDPAQTGVLSSVVRGPNVRDVTSIVKLMSLRPSTRYEIAAMLRSGAMAMSLAEESYGCDPIPYRFVRKPLNVQTMGMDIMQKPGTDPASWQMTAMPLDTFIALANNSYYPIVVPGFTYEGLDITWTGVPVPSRLIGQSHLLAYLYAFLSSDAWSGTVTARVSTVRMGPNNKKYKFNETYLPTVNNVNIPGVRRVCLVLIDETSYNAPDKLSIALRDLSVDVPVWKGPTSVASVSSWPLWDKFWKTDNLAGMRHDTILAYNEICTQLGVSDACGTALSLLSELYGQWYCGLAPTYKPDAPQPDYTQAAYGAWTYDASPLDKTGQIKSYLFNLDQQDKTDARRRCIAYNFSGLTPQHICPSGVVRIRYVDVSTFLRISWSTQQPEVAVPTYKIQTMTSMMRVATALGLVMTHTNSYQFASPTGFVHWVHMLSCAVSFSTSAFLSINDITPKDWAGLYNKYDVAHRYMVLNTLKTSMYGEIVVHYDIENIFSNINEWDLDIMADYWLMSPYSNINWLTFSPVPFHCTMQWVNKLDLGEGSVPKGVTTFRYKNIPYMAIKIQKDNGAAKMNAVATIDVYRRFPQVLVREPGEGYVPTLHWFDNVAGYSNAACSNNRILAPQDMYESLTFCANVNNIGIPYSDPTDWYILGSNYEYADSAMAETRLTPIQYPLILDTLWQGAKIV